MKSDFQVNKFLPSFDGKSLSLSVLATLSVNDDIHQYGVRISIGKNGHGRFNVTGNSGYCWSGKIHARSFDEFIGKIEGLSAAYQCELYPLDESTVGGSLDESVNFVNGVRELRETVPETFFTD